MKRLRLLLGRRIKYILLTSIFTLTFALSIILGSSSPTYSQAPTSDLCQKFVAEKNKYASCEKLIVDIHEAAKRHVVGGEAMQTLAIKRVYEDNRLGLRSPEIAKIYEEEYLRLKTESPWLQLPLSWLFVFALGLGAIIYKFSEQWLVISLDKIFSWFYYQLAGSPLFLGIALSRYQQSLVDRYQKLKIVYRSNRPLDMAEVYVPLKVAGSRDSEQIEAREAIAKYPRLMVKGLPGSGKSMLLKHLALIYGTEGGLNNLSTRPIPILIELHELTDPTLDLEKLEQHLVTVLDRNNFPKAERFISQSLKQGKLLLLFDGLDEVNSNVRRQVVQTIKNLLQKDQYRKCPALITCRTAVYNDEFNDVVDQTLEIVEFNDRQIRLFLKSWESQMPPEKSIDQLLTTLRDKPKIMTLARNPLLLTIIAYLYCDKLFVLPDSRFDFYRKSTDVLLELRDEERNIANTYQANEKRRVLQKLALYYQDNAQAEEQDRRSIDYKIVLVEIRKVLPDLNRDAEGDTIPILKEIVERSGLFIEIDSGDKYQFAHLSIQEFFAAEALRIDWRNLYLEVEYEFNNSWHYQIVLVLATAMSILAIIAISLIIFRQPEHWSNGLLFLAVLIIIPFLTYFWDDPKEQIKPNTFTNLGLFGFLNFWVELRRLFIEQKVPTDIQTVNQVGVSSFAVGGAGALTGAVIGFGMIARAIVGALVGFGTIAIFVSMSRLKRDSDVMFGAAFCSLVGAAAGAAAGETIASAMVCAGIAAIIAFGGFHWAIADTEATEISREDKNFVRFLAIFAYPFLCWSPIVFYFSTLALLEFLSWQYTVLVWLAVLGVGTALWMRGQKLEEQARNPLKGILPEKLS